MAKVTMPQLGESVAEGTIGRWLKQPGDAVAKYEPLLEVITDKVNAEVPSPFAGILREILAPEGATVPNNAEIAVIETAEDTGDAVADAVADAGGSDAPAPAEAAPAEAAPAEAAPATTSPAATITSPDATSSPAATITSPAATIASPAQAPATAQPDPEPLGDPNARMTPAVRRLLREHDLEPAQVAGTGGGGRVTREDVIAHVEALRTGSSPAARSSQEPASREAGAGLQSAAAPVGAPARPTAPVTAASASSDRTIAFPAGADEVLVPMSQMRKGIAAQMTKSLQAPHAYLQVEVDVHRLVALRDAQKRAYQAKEGIGLSFVPFVVKASTEALKRNPRFNAHWTDQGLLAKRRINIGVAVAMDDGLIVPVIRDADQLSIHGLNRAIADVAGRARAGKLRLDDFGGGTFTVDNTGYLGTNLVMPILNVPEVGIVTMEAITRRPVVVSTADGDVIAIRPIMNMVLGIDHRANDGAGGAALLREIKAWLEAVGPDTAIY